MKKNIGTADKTVRLIIVLIAITLYFADVLNSTLLLVLIVGITVTALVNTCPIYRLLGISTRRPAKKA